MLMVISLSNLNQFSIFFRWPILQYICSKTITKNPTEPCMCWYITFWNINVRIQAINDKLQGSVAT